MSSNYFMRNLLISVRWFIVLLAIKNKILVAKKLFFIEFYNKKSKTIQLTKKKVVVNLLHGPKKGLTFYAIFSFI